jgi:hypothetical protein
MSKVSDNYLLDLGALLRERALQARAQFHASSGTESNAFDSGKYFAYYEVISLMLSQAGAFGLAPAQLSLAALDPDKDLLG